VNGATEIRIAPVEGSYPGMVEHRAYELRLKSSFPPLRVTVNGIVAPYRPDGRAPGWRYDGNSVTTIISLPGSSVHTSMRVTIIARKGANDERDLLDGVPGKILRAKAAIDVLNTTWPVEWSPDDLVSAFQVGNRMTLAPSSAAAELRKLRDTTPTIVDEIRALQISPAVIERALAKLGIQHSAAAVSGQR
jgi:alpha-glucosidase